MNRDIISIDCIMGSFMMLRKQDIFPIGGFDETYKLYLDDTDLCRI